MLLYKTAAGWLDTFEPHLIITYTLWKYQSLKNIGAVIILCYYVPIGWNLKYIELKSVKDIFFHSFVCHFISYQAATPCQRAQWFQMLLFFFYFLFIYFFLLFRTTLAAYGVSQSRGRIQAISATYTTVHSDTGSLTHWAKPGIKPTSSWIPVSFVNYWALKGTPQALFF